jgi:hypothetical protein
MKSVVLVLIAEGLLVFVFLGWQIGSCYLHNYELNDEMTALAVQSRARVGTEAVATEDELRTSVISKAKDYGIELRPEQVAVHETMIAGEFAQDGTVKPGVLDISLEADYDAPVKLIGTLFTIHFAPMAAHRATVILK